MVPPKNYIFGYFTTKICCSSPIRIAAVCSLRINDPQILKHCLLPDIAAVVAQYPKETSINIMAGFDSTLTHSLSLWSSSDGGISQLHLWCATSKLNEHCNEQTKTELNSPHNLFQKCYPIVKSYSLFPLDDLGMFINNSWQPSKLILVILKTRQPVL